MYFLRGADTVVLRSSVYSAHRWGWYSELGSASQASERNGWEGGSHLDGAGNFDRRVPTARRIETLQGSITKCLSQQHCNIPPLNRWRKAEYTQLAAILTDVDMDMARFFRSITLHGRSGEPLLLTGWRSTRDDTGIWTARRRVVNATGGSPVWWDRATCAFYGAPSKHAQWLQLSTGFSANAQGTIIAIYYSSLDDIRGSLKGYLAMTLSACVHGRMFSPLLDLIPLHTQCMDNTHATILPRFT